MADLKKPADQAEQLQIEKTPEATDVSVVISGLPNQELHGQAFEKAHANDKTLSEPDLIAMEDGETLAEYKARIEKIQANRFGFYDSEEEQDGSAEETGTVTDYEPRKTDVNTYSLGMNYKEGRDSQSVYEKLISLTQSATARASDPEAWKTWAQGEIDKMIGIGEGLNIAKDKTKEAAAVGWKALTDGTLVNFLSKPNAINDPLFGTIGRALDSMSKDPNASKQALEMLGTQIMAASEQYSALPNREKGHVIGETMFGFVNPEGSTEGAEAAMKIADGFATQVDTAVMQGIQKSMLAAEEIAVTSPELAIQAKQMLYEYTKQLGLTPQEMQYAGIREDYFDIMKHPAGNGDDFFAMSKADELKGEAEMPRKAGAGGDWPTKNERPSLDVVKQTESMSCVSACGEMLSRGNIAQADLIRELGAPCDTRSLASALGPPWRGGGLLPAQLDEVLKRGSWATELREPVGHRFRRMEPGHTVVVDGLDELGNLIIRDPAEGTKYEMIRDDFLRYWSGLSVFRD